MALVLRITAVIHYIQSSMWYGKDKSTIKSLFSVSCCKFSSVFFLVPVCKKANEDVFLFCS